jgi:hypothetical protein
VIDADLPLGHSPADLDKTKLTKVYNCITTVMLFTTELVNDLLQRF